MVRHHSSRRPKRSRMFLSFSKPASTTLPSVTDESRRSMMNKRTAVLLRKSALVDLRVMVDTNTRFGYARPSAELRGRVLKQHYRMLKRIWNETQRPLRNKVRLSIENGLQKF